MRNDQEYILKSIVNIIRTAHRDKKILKRLFNIARLTESHRRDLFPGPRVSLSPPSPEWVPDTS